MLNRFPAIASTCMVAILSISALFSMTVPASAQEIITCESQNNRTRSCSISTGGRVRLVRQLSSASCAGNWGYNANRIWVKDGCRAQFAVGDRNDRNGRYDRDDRNDRNGRYDRDHRNDRNDRNGRYDRDDRNGRYNRSDRNYRNGRNGNYDRNDRYGR
jgi:hypothetical protein